MDNLQHYFFFVTLSSKVTTQHPYKKLLVNKP